ncbi:MAG TPA: hypothetical protein VNH40_11115 [Gaiellaceae bacterium]|nr:hypothetical protein [Gaiellaceae bacterium]
MRTRSPAQLEQPADQVEAQPIADLSHDAFNPRIGELDHVAAVDGDQVIVPRLAGVLVAGAVVREVEDQIWLVSFLDYDLGFFDQDEGRIEPGPNPFAPEQV